ncbi:MAG: hypothetical protein IPM61_15825 [Chlorobi bacterium]|nr:MAG: hypothetical protein UZ07_CHB004002280 [Chlorobi bacterium OLB7]MBK8912777.1 hypothetical protein [Chlorobiota bacterium]MBX7218036.1 hypothetical protein [Candidatus Kapabacteria bacterium]
MQRFLLVRRLAIGALLLMLGAATASNAQWSARPSIGVQTMWFNGDNAIRQPISPGTARELPLGGGMNGTHPGLQLQLDLLPSNESSFRFPISLEAFSLVGKTTFAATPDVDKRKRRWLFRHSAEVYSVGAGVTYNLVGGLPSLYVSGQGKVNFITSSDLLSRIYYSDNGSVIVERTVHPDTANKTRFGAYLEIGSQVEFFEPLLLDFSIGYGALNIGGRDTDPVTQRNLLVVDNQRRDPEAIIGFVGVNFSIIWKL